MNSTPDSPLLAALRDSGRLTAEQLVAAERAFAEVGTNAGQLADRLLEHGCVTRYQHRKIQLGRAGDLLFGHYLILERVGEGGMGKVYRAIELRLARMVALKTIRPNLLANRVVVSRYKREARAAAALKHPNIVELFEAEDVDGRYYLAMEFVEGMDLSRLTKELAKDKRSIAPAEAAEYIRQAALGLQHAHEKGLVHRDVKPSNLLVSGERAIPGTGGVAKVKILDMGLVRSLTEEDATQVDLTRDGTVVGTPDYMAPEQAKNSSTVDHRADLYSLGCTMFFLLKGTPPYHEGSAIDKLIRHQLDPIPDIRQFRPDVPAGLAAVIRRMMAKRPDDRFQSGEEVAKELALFTSEAASFDFAEGNITQPYQYVDLSPNSASPESRSNEVTVPATTAATPAPASGGRTVRPLVTQPGQRTVRPVVTPTPQRTVQPVRPKPIDKPTSDGTPSDSLPEGEAKKASREDTPAGGGRGRKPNRRPPRQKDNGFPVIPIAIIAAILTGLIVVAAIIVSRSNTVPTTPSTNNHSTKPVTVVPPPNPFRPIPELLPDQTAAVLIAHPKRYWDAGQQLEAQFPPVVRKNFEFLTRFFKFDPWQFDRVVVAMQSNPHKCVAAGEGEVLVKPESFRTELEQHLVRFKFETDKNGVTLLRPRAVANQFNPERKVRAILLPAPSAYLIGTDMTDFAELYRGVASRKAPEGVNPKLLSAVTNTATTDTGSSQLVYLAASGDWQIPKKGGQAGEPLRKHGVELLTLVVRMEEMQFRFDLMLMGPDGNRLKQFAQWELPEMIESHVVGEDGKTLKKAILAACDDVQPTNDHGETKLTVTFSWDWRTIHSAFEKVIPLPPIGPPGER